MTIKNPHSGRKKRGWNWPPGVGDTLNGEKQIPPVSLRSRVGMTSGGAGILRLRFRPLVADENFVQDDKLKGCGPVRLGRWVAGGGCSYMSNGEGKSRFLLALTSLCSARAASE